MITYIEYHAQWLPLAWPAKPAVMGLMGRYFESCSRSFTRRFCWYESPGNLRSVENTSFKRDSSPLDQRGVLHSKFKSKALGLIRTWPLSDMRSCSRCPPQPPRACAGSQEGGGRPRLHLPRPCRHVPPASADFQGQSKGIRAASRCVGFSSESPNSSVYLAFLRLKYDCPGVTDHDPSTKLCTVRATAPFQTW